jgi:pimeloyl-ACP methyl ester carboxylesterase
MAGRYLDIIEHLRCPPPYDILGYSMGGLIAFEMATQLARQDRQVRLLGLLDPPVPGSLGLPDEARVLRVMARTLGITSVVTAATPDAEELLALLVAEAKAAGVLPDAYTVEDMRPTVEIQLTNGRAASVYARRHRTRPDLGTAARRHRRGQAARRVHRPKAGADGRAGPATAGARRRGRAEVYAGHGVRHQPRDGVQLPAARGRHGLNAREADLHRRSARPTSAAVGRYSAGTPAPNR